MIIKFYNFNTLGSSEPTPAPPSEEDTGHDEKNEAPANKTDEETTTPKPTEDEKTEKSGNETKPVDKKNETAAGTLKKPKLVTIRENIDTNTVVLDVMPLDGEKLKKAIKK